MDERDASLADGSYKVLCIEAEAGQAEGHDHVRFVETRDPDGAETRWKSVDVIAAIRDGAEFVIADDAGGRRTILEPAVCPNCALATVSADPPAARPARCD